MAEEKGLGVLTAEEVALVEEDRFIPEHVVAAQERAELAALDDDVQPDVPFHDDFGAVFAPRLAVEAEPEGKQEEPQEGDSIQNDGDGGAKPGEEKSPSPTRSSGGRFVKFSTFPSFLFVPFHLNDSQQCPG